MLILFLLIPPPSPIYSTNFFYLPFGRMAKQHVVINDQTVALDIVRVGGRYRVGKLLGAGTFGRSI